LNLDLMFGYPGHTAGTWARTLEAALALEPEHVSAYGYIVEAGTPLGDAVGRGDASPVPPELEAELHAQADSAFAAAGLAPYETSNWSRPGAECRHNLTYWLRRDYLALGPSSHGLWRGERYENARALNAWAASLEVGNDPAVAREAGIAAARTEEAVMLALRLASGLEMRDFPPDMRDELEMRYGQAFADAETGGRLERTRHGWSIPARAALRRRRHHRVARRARATSPQGACRVTAQPKRATTEAAKPSTFRENVESLAWAIGLMLIVRIFLLQAFRIPSESMRDTLLVGDFLFVTKFDYGPKIPFTHFRLPGLRRPKPGDIIVFQYPVDPSQDFIKRCIATGGQTVEVRHKEVWVDGVKRDEPFALHTQWSEEPAAMSPRDNRAPDKVPPQDLFMMGDNRENSADSRYWGYLPMDLVKGRALFIYFSTASQHWWDMPFYIRWNRLFKILH
jgi:signal peptidase I